MKGTQMSGWWDSECPVKTDNPDVLATVYRKPGKSLIALASWAKEKDEVRLNIDWKALGLDPKKTKLRAAAIEGFQPEAKFAVDGAIAVEPGKGWLIVAEEGRQ
jgi:hypothetical protein